MNSCCGRLACFGIVLLAFLAPAGADSACDQSEAFAIDNSPCGESEAFAIDNRVIAVAWRSVRTHTAPVGSAPGACGNPPKELAIELDASVTPDPDVTVETRVGGVRKIEVDFNDPVAQVTGTIQATGERFMPVVADSATLTNGGQTLEILFNNGLPNEDCWTIDLAGHIPYLTGDTDCRVKALTGDIDRGGAGMGTITIGDAIAVNQHYNGHNPCTGPDAVQADVDCNGTITIGDAITVNQYNGRRASCE